MLSPAGAYDRSLRAVMWWDAFLSLEAALLAIVALPIVMLVDLPRSIATGVGVAAIVSAIVLAACGVVTAALIGLRMRQGEDFLPASLRLSVAGLDAADTAGATTAQPFAAGPPVVCAA